MHVHLTQLGLFWQAGGFWPTQVLPQLTITIPECCHGVGRTGCAKTGQPICMLMGSSTPKASQSERLLRRAHCSQTRQPMSLIMSAGSSQACESVHVIVGGLTAPIVIAMLTEATVMLVEAAASQQLSQLAVLFSLSGRARGRVIGSRLGVPGCPRCIAWLRLVHGLPLQLVPLMFSRVPGLVAQRLLQLNLNILRLLLVLLGLAKVQAKGLLVSKAGESPRLAARSPHVGGEGPYGWLMRIPLQHVLWQRSGSWAAHAWCSRRPIPRGLAQGWVHEWQLLLLRLLALHATCITVATTDTDT